MDVDRLQANKDAKPKGDHMGFLKAGQAAQFSGYAASIFLDNAQDWELVADLKGHGKYPDVIQRSRQRPDKVIHSCPHISSRWLS